MGEWKGPAGNRQIGRPLGQQNHNTRLSKQIDKLLKDSALQFVKQVIDKALQGSAMHEKMYWDELTKRDSPLLQLLIQNNVNGQIPPSLIVNFQAGTPRPKEQPVTTIDAVLEPDDVTPRPRQGFIRTRLLQ